MSKKREAQLAFGSLCKSSRADRTDYSVSLEKRRKKEVKKVIKSKNGFIKSCPKFCKLGDEFILFWRNLKNEAATAEKR